MNKIILSAILAFSFLEVGCASKKKADEPAPAPAVEPAQTSYPEPQEELHKPVQKTGKAKKKIKKKTL